MEMKHIFEEFDPYDCQCHKKTKSPRTMRIGGFYISHTFAFTTLSTEFQRYEDEKVDPTLGQHVASGRPSVAFHSFDQCLHHLRLFRQLDDSFSRLLHGIHRLR